MRITNNMLIGNMTYNLNKTLNRMEKLQYQSSTGKKFRVPSEDPIGASKSLKLRTDISKISQYRRNVSDAQSWMKESESAIKEINGITKRAYELTVQAANGINAGDDLEKIKAEISELKDNMIQLANSSYGGRTIFTGHSTDKKLIDKSGEFIVGLEKAFVTKIVTEDEDNKKVEVEYLLGKDGKILEVGDNDNKTKVKLEEIKDVDTGKIDKDKLNDFLTNNNLKKEDLKLKEQTVEYNIGISETIEVNTVGNKVFGKAVYEAKKDGDNYYFVDKAGEFIKDSDDNKIKYVEIRDLTDDSKKETLELLQEKGVLKADYTSEVRAGDKSYVIALFEDLERNLANEDSEGLQRNITDLQGIEHNILSVTAQIGARDNRLNITTEKLENQALNLEELLSDVEDVDIPETYMRYLLKKNVYNASLSVGSQIIQQSLVDFIR